MRLLGVPGLNLDIKIILVGLFMVIVYLNKNKKNTVSCELCYSSDNLNDSILRKYSVCVKYSV